MRSSCPTVTVAIPCYKSEKTIGKVVRLSREELRGLGYATEFVLVDDCSGDGTYDEICRLARESDDVFGINLAKNSGQHAAIMCALHHVHGDIVVLMDDDMQTHPSQLRLMLEALTDDVDVVFGKYPRRKEALWRRMGSAFWRWSMRVMTSCPRHIELTSFVAMRRRVVDEMVRYDGPYPVIQGLVFRATSHVVNADVQHFDREVGTSGYTLKALIRLWSNILNFSMMPLRAATAIGSIMGIIGLISVVFLTIRKLMLPETPMGWSSTMVTLLTCSGLVILTLGIVGEYVGRVFMTANRTPQFVERTTTDQGEGA